MANIDLTVWTFTTMIWDTLETIETHARTIFMDIILAIAGVLGHSTVRLNSIG